MVSVLADRQHLKRFQEVLTQGAYPSRGGENTMKVEDLTKALQARVKAGVELRWTDVRLVEKAAEEIAAEFDGEDPLKPVLRKAINKTKRPSKGWRSN